MTGASSGIGRRLALDLADSGAVVVGVARREVLLAELEGELTSVTPRSSTRVCDVGDADAYVSLLADIEKQHGRIDILVNDAGTEQLTPVAQGMSDAYRRLFDVNFFGLVAGTLAVLPGMQARRSGIIVNVSSDSARAPEPGHGAYAASKAAVSAFTEAWPTKWRLRGSTSTSSIRPGFRRPWACRGPRTAVLFRPGSSAATWNRSRLWSCDVWAVPAWRSTPPCSPSSPPWAGRWRPSRTRRRSAAGRTNCVAILPDHLRTVAQRFGDRVALRVAVGPASNETVSNDTVSNDTVSNETVFSEMTYAEWDGRSNAVARGLAAAGVGRGDRVALFVGNDAAALYQVAYFAVLKAGAVAVPVNPRVARRELEHMVSDSGASAIVAGPGEIDRARALPPRAVGRPHPRHRSGGRPPGRERLGRTGGGGPLALPDRGRSRRHRRHPLHLGNDRAPERGGRHPPERPRLPSADAHREIHLSAPLHSAGHLPRDPRHPDPLPAAGRHQSPAPLIRRPAFRPL